MEQGRSDKLEVVPITQKEAIAYVSMHHRHHKPPPGSVFCIAVATGEVVRGVAMVGRPVSRMLQDGWTLEVNRCCTDGTRNACSMLYGASWRVARALGWRRLVTYTLPEEGGASLRGAGWKLIGRAGGGRLESRRETAGGHSPATAEIKMGDVRWTLTTCQ